MNPLSERTSVFHPCSIRGFNRLAVRDGQIQFFKLSVIIILWLTIAMQCTSVAIGMEPIQHRVVGVDNGHAAIVNAKGEVEWEVPCKHDAHDIAMLPSGNVLL